ncbi:MAG: hypothetical protein M1821_008573 [Bathelium mastoideum]|nr:MAG: hypothetical protein M1821_008573 [Bathelium mastoideum]
MAQVDILEALPVQERPNFVAPPSLATFHKKRVQSNGTPLYLCGMDPLSVATSILAVAGAAVTACNIISKLHDAPSEVCGLLEELQDLQAVLAGLHPVVKSFSIDDRFSSTRLLTQSLSDLLDRAKGKIGRIGGIVHGILDRAPNENGKIKISQVSRVSWLRERKKVKILQEDIRSIKLSLALLLGAVTSDNITKVHAQVVEFSCLTKNFLNTKVQTGSEATSRAASPIPNEHFEEPPEYAEVVGDHDHQITGVIDKNIAGDVKAVVPGRAPWTTDPVRPSLRRNCTKSCKCVCHKRNKLQTPSLLKSTLGSLSIDFGSLPWQGWTCLPGCRRRSTASADINYLFPRWLMMRKLQASFQQAVGGPEFLLRVSRQLPAQNKLSSMVYQAQIDNVRSLFAEKLASPFDVSGRLNSPLLFHGIYSENIDMCKLLLYHGVDKYAQNDSGLRAIDEAWNYILTLKEGKKRTEFEELFKAEDYFDEKGFNIIHRVSTGVSTNISLEDALFSSGEDVDAQDVDGRTALSWAAARGDFTSTQTLLAYEADPNLVDRRGCGPLFFACRSSSLECANILLSYGADPSFKTDWGDGALHNAGKYSAGTTELALRLILAGAPVNLRDCCGWTPISYTACFAHDAGIVETLMDHGADMQNREETGLTPLMQAVKFNSHDCIRVMLRKDPEWIRTTTCWRGNSLLHIAAEHGNAGTFNILANERLLGTDSRRQNSKDKTAQDLFEERLDIFDELRTAWKGLISTVTEQEIADEYADDSDSFSGLEKGLKSVSIFEDTLSTPSASCSYDH